MVGCAVTLLQIPIIWTLYKVFLKMPGEVSSIIIPWVSSLKLSDAFFIVPVISVLFQLMPNILIATGIIKNYITPKPSKSQFVVSAVLTLIFVAKAPLTLGLYWLSSNLFTAIEQICYSLYMRKNCLN
jgi:YidC/Oxa1 family membrane protein insertase